MRFAIMGAGAVGCYYGGLLARAGHEVVLIGRPTHVEAIRRDGLRLEIAAQQQFIPLIASTEASAAADADVVLFCVKSVDTETAASLLAPYLEADCRVLSLQNGLGNIERLQAALRVPVAPVAVYVAAEMAGPGHVRHHGRGELIFGPFPGAEALAAVFSGAGVPTTVSGSVAEALWGKLILNCAYNALSAITRLPYGHLVRVSGIEATMREAVAECLAVAKAEGVEVAETIWQTVADIARTMPHQMSSTAQDLARRKRSEIDFLNGHVARRGAELGIPTPVNRALHALVRALESSMEITS